MSETPVPPAAPPPGARPRWAVPLIVLGVVVGVGIGGVVTGLRYARLWMEGKVTEVALDLPGLHAAGAEFGGEHPAEACVDAGLTRALPCEKMDMFCQMGAALFAHGCLTTAAGAPELCAGVPMESDTAAVREWAENQCDARGHADAPTCAPLLIQSWARYCTDGGEAAVPSMAPAGASSPESSP